MGISSALQSHCDFPPASTSAHTTCAALATEPSPLAAAARQLVQLNRQFLNLVAVDSLFPDVVRLDSLSNEALAAMSDCVFSLFTLGFEDKRRWLLLLNSVSTEAAPALTSSRNAVEYSEFINTAIVFAWHLANSDPLAAKVLLELDDSVAASLRTTSVRDLRTIAIRAASWLQPRWPQNRFFWSTLARNATSPESVALPSARLLGRQLLAAQALALSPGSDADDERCLPQVQSKMTRSQVIRSEIVRSKVVRTNRSTPAVTSLFARNLLDSIAAP